MRSIETQSMCAGVLFVCQKGWRAWVVMRRISPSRLSAPGKHRTRPHIHTDTTCPRPHARAPPPVCPLHTRTYTHIHTHFLTRTRQTHTQTQKLTCAKCGKEGHLLRSCPFELCFGCGEPGHQQRVRESPPPARRILPPFPPRPFRCNVLGLCALEHSHACTQTATTKRHVSHEASTLFPCITGCVNPPPHPSFPFPPRPFRCNVLELCTREHSHTCTHTASSNDSCSHEFPLRSFGSALSRPQDCRSGRRRWDPCERCGTKGHGMDVCVER